MIKVLLIIQDKNSADLIKAACCYKGCRVFSADNSDEILHFIIENKIDIVFLDLNSLYWPTFDQIFSVQRFEHEIPVIMISEQTTLSVQEEIRKYKIFYHAVVPFFTGEIELVIDAAIKIVTTEKFEKDYYDEKIIAASNTINKEKIKISRQNIIRYAFRNFQNIDKIIINSIQNIDFKYLENYLSFAAKPFKKIDASLARFIK